MLPSAKLRANNRLQVKHTIIAAHLASVWAAGRLWNIQVRDSWQEIHLKRISTAPKIWGFVTLSFGIWKLERAFIWDLSEKFEIPLINSIRNKYISLSPLFFKVEHRYMYFKLNYLKYE